MMRRPILVARIQGMPATTWNFRLPPYNAGVILKSGSAGPSNLAGAYLDGDMVLSCRSHLEAGYAEGEMTGSETEAGAPW